MATYSDSGGWCGGGGCCAGGLGVLWDRNNERFINWSCE